MFENYLSSTGHTVRDVFTAYIDAYLLAMERQNTFAPTILLSPDILVVCLSISCFSFPFVKEMHVECYLYLVIVVRLMSMTAAVSVPYRGPEDA